MHDSHTTTNTTVAHMQIVVDVFVAVIAVEQKCGFKYVSELIING